MVKQYQLSIKQIYLDNIIKGYKTHEYRLATSKRRKIAIGDELILVSNTNPNYKVTVIVNDIKIFNSWHDALLNTWKQDFKGIYSSLEECIKACEKFYPIDEVIKNKLIVYQIKEK